MHRFVDLCADPRHGRPADAGVVAQGTDELLDLAGADPVDPGLADHRVEGLVDPTARVQQRGEERSLPQLRDRKIHLPGRRREDLRPGPVAAGGPLRGAFVTGGADLRGRLRVDEVLQASLQHPPEHILVREVGVGEDFTDQGRKGRLVLGHRGISALLLAGNNWSSHGGPPTSTTTRTPQELTPRYGTHPSAGRWVPLSLSNSPTTRDIRD